MNNLAFGSAESDEDDVDFQPASLKTWKDRSNVQQCPAGRAPAHLHGKTSTRGPGRTSIPKVKGSVHMGLCGTTSRQRTKGSAKKGQVSPRRLTSKTNRQFAGDGGPSLIQRLPSPSFPPLPDLSGTSDSTVTSRSTQVLGDAKTTEDVLLSGSRQETSTVWRLTTQTQTPVAGNIIDGLVPMAGSDTDTLAPVVDVQAGDKATKTFGIACKRPSTDSGISLPSLCPSLNGDVEEDEGEEAKTKQLKLDSQTKDKLHELSSISVPLSPSTEWVSQTNTRASTFTSEEIGDLSCSRGPLLLSTSSGACDSWFEAMSATVGSGPKRQSSLLSFLPGYSQKVVKNNVNPVHPRPPPTVSLGAAPPLSTCTSVARQPSTSRKYTHRSCPFHKTVPGTGFVVDAFSYGSIPGCTGYFLSHFHSDHYQGLSKRFRHTIYCSQETANLVTHSIGVAGDFILPLAMNEPHLVDGVEVTLLDANHCPGSVMFLFKLSSGKNYLHTGDFRYCDGMKLYPHLIGCPIHRLFLDTTYCSPQYNFPPQTEVVGFAIQRTLTALRTNPRTLVVCGSYTIGKEKVFLAIAEVLGSKVCVSREKKAILDCLESERISELITTDPCQASVHVLPMGRLSIDGLSDYLDRLRPGHTSLLAFKPTGWTHSSKRLGLDSIKPQARGSVTIYGIPYSEHSSYYELKDFVQFLRPENVIPTVLGGKKHIQEMERHFHNWLSPPSCSGATPPARQIRIDTVFMS